MANGWTPERKARQAELIHNWQPWKQNTGPKTEAGKAKVSRNGWKGGQRAQLQELIRMDNAEVKRARETLTNC